MLVPVVCVVCTYIKVLYMCDGLMLMLLVVLVFAGIHPV